MNTRGGLKESLIYLYVFAGVFLKEKVCQNFYRKFDREDVVEI